MVTGFVGMTAVERIVMACKTISMTSSRRALVTTCMIGKD